MTLGFGPYPDFSWSWSSRRCEGPSFAWWVRFVMDIGWRGTAKGVSPDDLGREPGFGRHGLFATQYMGFRFTQQNLDLDAYDGANGSSADERH